MAGPSTPRRRTGRPLLPLAARFDDAVMRPPPAVSHFARQHFERDLSARLRQWCDADAGDGSSPFFRPTLLPEMTRPLAVGALVGEPAESLAAAVAVFALALDGSERLERSGGVGGLVYRAGVKLADCCWWRRRRESDPWDCGYLRHEPAAVARVDSFLPRRATLLVAQDMAAPTLRKIVVTLRHRQAHFPHPVRLLVLGPTLASGLEPIDVIEPPGSTA